MHGNITKIKERILCNDLHFYYRNMNANEPPAELFNLFFIHSSTQTTTIQPSHTTEPPYPAHRGREVCVHRLSQVPDGSVVRPGRSGSGVADWLIQFITLVCGVRACLLTTTMSSCPDPRLLSRQARTKLLGGLDWRWEGHCCSLTAWNLLSGFRRR